jgi:CMP-N-acetylneuraminic acid synthetase
VKVIAFVPIRLNSKRIIGKNLKLLGEKPLMVHVLDTLLKVPKIDEIFVYCSQSDVIQYLPQEIKFLKRNADLDRDETLGEEIYAPFVKEIYADVYILAHATSPFINHVTIENALNQILEYGYDSAFSVEKIQTFAWYNGNPLNYNLKKVPRTQDIEPVFVETSAFYMFKREVWCKEKQRIGHNPYMQIVDKIEGVDIDNPYDFDMAEIIYKAKKDQASCF